MSAVERQRTVEEWTDDELAEATAMEYQPRIEGQVNRRREAFVALQHARATLAEQAARIEELEEENRQQRLDWQERQDEYESQLRGADLTLDALRNLKGPDQAAAVAYVHPETGHGSATGANQPNYEMTAYVVDWKQRAEAAEAKLRDRTGPLHDSECDRCQLESSVRADKAEADRDSLLSACAAAGWNIIEGDPEGFIKEMRAEVKKAWSERDHYLNAVMERNTELRKAEAERDWLAWMLERIRDSEYDRMSDADALADLAARYDARHEGGDG